jgi:serine/threonine protein kinase
MSAITEVKVCVGRRGRPVGWRSHFPHRWRFHRYNPDCLDDETDLPARARVGTVLDDKWTLERLLGVGGMAAVYAARHRNGARAAVKVLHPDLSRYQEVRERFQREGYAANRVGHPGAVKVLDDDVVSGGPEAGTAYIVMEMLDGCSMQERLERGPAMSEIEFLRIADRVLDVLRAAHARGVVHRDLKPENLFLVRDDTSGDGPRVKVLDFGLARILQGQAITKYGFALGTPSFMSPEQAAGRLEEIDGRTDLFALAATGFRLRTGRRIHEGANAVELVSKMASLSAPPIRSMAPDVSVSFARVVDRALEFRRGDRYATAAEMQTDVRQALCELEGAPGRNPVARDAPSSALATESEKTIDISRRDIEPSAATRAVASTLRVARRSFVPWVAAVLFGAMATELGLQVRARSLRLASRRTDLASTAASSSGSAAAASSASTAASSSASAVAASSTSAAASSSASTEAPSSASTASSLSASAAAPSSAASVRPPSAASSGGPSSASVAPSRAGAPSSRASSYPAAAKAGPGTAPKLPHAHRAGGRRVKRPSHG